MAQLIAASNALSGYGCVVCASVVSSIRNLLKMAVNECGRSTSLRVRQNVTERGKSILCISKENVG